MMKKWLIIFALFITACGSTPKPSALLLGTKPDVKKPLYTAYNIWIHRGYNMECMNWKGSKDFIPAGTPVQKVRIIQIKEIGNEMKDFIRFKVRGSNRYFKIGFKKRYHPGRKIKDYKNYMFTNKTFEELTEGFTTEEIVAVKSGMITNNMSKRAVMVSWGIPPEHRTRNLDDSTWFYWKNKWVKEKICFDQDGRTMTCEKPKRKRR